MPPFLKSYVMLDLRRKGRFFALPIHRHSFEATFNTHFLHPGFEVRRGFSARVLLQSQEIQENHGGPRGRNLVSFEGLAKSYIVGFCTRASTKGLRPGRGLRRIGT